LALDTAEGSAGTSLHTEFEVLRALHLPLHGHSRRNLVGREVILRTVAIAREPSGYFCPPFGRPIVKWQSSLVRVTSSSQDIKPHADTMTCIPPGRCVVLGTYVTTVAHPKTLADIHGAFILSGKGQSWTVNSAPRPADIAVGGGFIGNFNDVSCTNAGHCAAVGYAFDQYYEQRAFLLSETDGSWQATDPTPGVSEYKADLTSVSCPPNGPCVGVGYIENDTFQGLLVRESGGGWNSINPPVPAGGTAAADLDYVSCASATSCLAVGEYTERFGYTEDG
jgi:hypothetical protein